MAHLGQLTFLVHDYDDAISFFVEALGFALLEDTDLGNGKRWVRVAPAGATETGMLLARAVDDAQRAAVGRQAGGRVAFFLHTDDFARDHARMTAAGVQFREPPRTEPYGTVAVFDDLYGNGWDLIQPTTAQEQA
jgi:catechol 2,3-dioxygenase-like lactoylglutathione lyase family enzyme